MDVKNNKRRTVILSVILVGVVALGLTLAYLFTKTETETNVFTFADNIKATLDEPSWNPEDALDLVPGKEIKKDPMITNTSINGLDEYVAVKLSFQKGDGTLIDDAELRDINGAADASGMTDMQRLLSLITIDWSQTWTLEDGAADSNEQIYVYNTILEPGVTSDPVFYSVTVNSDVTPEELLWLAGNFGHTADCYEFDACDCTVTYKHSERCAIYGMSGAENVAAGGSLGAATCDCNPSVVHEKGCASLIGHLKDDCGHTTAISGLGNFNIVVDGAAVQADAFDARADAVTDLVGLFSN